MKFTALLAAEAREPAYVPPPSRQATDAFVAALKGELKRKQERAESK